jgi:hypothetical protein
LGEANVEPCPKEHSHHAGETSPRHHHHDAGLACCCDCLGCVSAVSLTPDLASVGAAVFGTTIRYTDTARFLPGRVLLPEPDPPRPSA